MAFLKQFYFFLFPMIMVTSCGALKGTVISGNLSGAENMTVYLDGVSITQQSNIILQEKSEQMENSNYLFLMVSKRRLQIKNRGTSR